MFPLQYSSISLGVWVPTFENHCFNLSPIFALCSPFLPDQTNNVSLSSALLRATDCETSAPAGNNELICNQCFCYICDKLASAVCAFVCEGNLMWQLCPEIDIKPGLFKLAVSDAKNCKYYSYSGSHELLYSLASRLDQL